MSSQMEHDYRELQSGRWAETNPAKCPCRGGWLLSDLDTYHRCPVHGGGVPHPEDEDATFDADAHRLACNRRAFLVFRETARRSGFRGNFNAACLKAAGRRTLTPVAWVNAAEMVAEEAVTASMEAKARRQGYSCALEMRLSDEAAIERRERHDYFRG